MTALLRRTLIIAAVVLVVALGVGMLLFRGETPVENSNTALPTNTVQENTNVVVSGNTNTADVPTTVVPLLSDTEEIKAVATVFGERFWSFHENTRERSVESVALLLTEENRTRLESDAALLAAAQDVKSPETYVAQVLTVTILSNTEAHATVNVSLSVETWAGHPLTQRSIHEQTSRLLLTKEDNNWKIANAAF